MDSANILSILQSLGQGAAPQPTNVLQQAAPPPPPIADIAQAATAASPPAPKPRRSLLDTIGRISDVLATVGGADPLYQPTLDAREKHGFDVQDHGLKVDEATIKNATDKFDLGDKHNLRLGQVARGLKAIQTAGGDIHQAWPVLAQRMQLDPDTISSVGQALASDPHALDGLIGATTDPKYDQSKYGGSVVYAKDANGHLVAYQPSLGNDGARSILPEGTEPVDPLQFVNTGGANVGVGKLSGKSKTILPNTAKPDTVLTTTTSRENNKDTNRTNLTIAGMPARAKDGATGSRASDPRAGLTIIADIQKSFDNLHGLNALPGEGGALGNLVGSVGRTQLGQAIGAKTGLSAAAQERELLAKNLANLQSDLIKSLPGNATRTRFEQEIQKKRLPDPATMNYATANRAIAQIKQAYLTALQSQKTAQTPVARAQASPGWTVVGVK
jgi:hypothetical protein